MKKKNQVVLLVSGGMDSFIAYHYLQKDNYDITPLFIDYKGRYTDKEFIVVNKLFPNVTLDQSINLGNSEIGDKAFIKNRNAYFALIASKYGKFICMAGLKDDNVGDKSPEAFIRMGSLLSEMNGEEYNVFSPFWQMTKEDILVWYLKHNLSLNREDRLKGFDDLVKTTSCYHSTELFCGECPSCFRKYCVFLMCGISNLIPPFTNKVLAKTYLQTVSLYTEDRQKSILNACNILGII